MTYGDHLSIVKIMAERDCYRECLDKLRSAVMGRDVTVRGMGDKQLHEATDEAVDAVRTRLMPEGYEAHGVVGTMLEYRRVLNGVCERLGLTDGTGKPEQDGVIYGELEKRLMPEGMEWPRYESGDPVLLGSMVSDTRGGSAAAISFELSDDRVYIRDFEGFPSQVLATGERVKRPAVLAADGEPLEVGQTVWGVEDGKEFKVVRPLCSDGLTLLKYRTESGGYVYTATEPEHLTHQRPVLDADGVPIEAGYVLYHISGFGHGVTVRQVMPPGCFEDTEFKRHIAAEYAHTKPERDSWERIEEDAAMQPYAYCVGNGLFEECDEIETTPTNELFARDLVRRCKALAGVSE